MDDLNQYRAVCASRVRRLERFKKTRSFCSLDQETTNDSDYASSGEPCRLHHRPCTSSSASSDNDDDSHDAFEMIKEKMIALMEDDVSLLQQLMNLSEKINEVKRGRGLLPKSLSQTSLHDDYERENEEDDLFDDDDTRFAASSSAVTTLYLNEDASSSSSVPPQPPQYFSRKNSVLRIPIPPRASNRLNRRPSDMNRHTRLLHIDPSSSSTSNPSSPFGRPSPSSLSSSTTSSASSTLSSSEGAKILLRSSTASSDSGRASSDSSIHSGSPSPTF